MPILAEKTPAKKYPVPPPVETHPLVVKHIQQRRELHEQLTAARAEHERLATERSAFAREGLENEVAVLLGDRPAVPEQSASRLAELDAALTRAARQIAALTAACERLEILASEERTRATAELRQQALAAARALVSDMLPHVKALELLNQQLILLTNPSGGFGAIPTPYQPTTLTTAGWLQIAEQFLESAR